MQSRADAAPWRWAALLGFALIGPVALPAGGADKRQPEVRRRELDVDPLVHPLASALRCAPLREAPALRQLQAGEPLRVLRQWFDPCGTQWVQVEVRLSDLVSSSRGWLKVD
jgi:hypothetical protein